MGNEFGHPEWIDFPRPGNNDSYQYARRQWSLVDNGYLRYSKLNSFDRALQTLDQVFGLLTDPLIEQLALHEDSRQMVYRRGPLVFVVNLHPTESFPDLRIPVPEPQDYHLVLSSDDVRYAGFGRVNEQEPMVWQDVPMYGCAQSIQIYLPNRTVMVYAPTRLSDEVLAYRTTISSRNTQDLPPADVCQSGN